MNPGANCERNVVTVDTDASVLRAAAIMRRHDLRYLVVIKSKVWRVDTLRYQDRARHRE